MDSHRALSPVEMSLVRCLFELLRISGFSQPIGKLMKLKQQPREGVQEYHKTWNKMVVATKEEDKIAISAFVNELKSSRVAYDLSKIDLTDVNALMNEVEKHVKAEFVVELANYSDVSLQQSKKGKNESDRVETNKDSHKRQRSPQ